MSQDKEIRADAKLKNLSAESLEDLWRFRNPEEGGTKLTMDAILVEIPLRYGFTVSLSTLSEFYSWLRLKRRLENAAARADQAREDELLKNPDATEKALDQRARIIFKTEALEKGDTLAWVRVKKAEQTDVALSHDDRRIALLEQKAAERDAAKDVTGNDALTAEEKQARLKQIFGMG